MPDPNSNNKNVVKLPHAQGATPPSPAHIPTPPPTPSSPPHIPTRPVEENPTSPAGTGMTFRPNRVKNPPKVTQDLKKILQNDLAKHAEGSSDLKELQKEGFPLAMVKTFLQTADNLDCVITSRIPEGPAGGLIAEGYDLKGYEIKSKSCTWGPMAGFLCKLPILSKYGFGKIEENYKYAAVYHKKWAVEPTIYSNLFQPIKISDERKNHLFTNTIKNFSLGKLDEEYLKLSDSLIYGICESGKKAKGDDKIRMEYLLKKDPDSHLWNIYHGTILYTHNKEPKAYTTDGIKKCITTKGNEAFNDKVLNVADKLIIKFTNDDDNKINKIRNKNNINTEISFHPIEGILNPYPPYPKRAPNKKRFWKKRNNTQVQPIVDISNIDNPDYYKNCVTGDYDLFACWPKLTYPIQELIRAAEHKLESRIEKDGENKITTTIPGKFFRNFGKPLSLSLCPSEVYNHIYIEFIPGLPILGDLEVPDKGNITDLTEMVAGTLNSISGFSFENEKIIINKAFHNDEGGRPMMNDIEFPVAYFIPDSLFEQLKTQNTGFAIRFQEHKGGLLQNIQDFLDLIMACTENGHRVSLNYGWIIYLITIAMDTVTRSKLKEAENPELIKERKKYFEKNPFIEGSTDKVLKYLFGYKIYIDKNKIIHYQATNNFLIKVANVFLPFLDMTETDTSVIIRKVNEAKSIEIQKSDFESYQETYKF